MVQIRDVKLVTLMTILTFYFFTSKLDRFATGLFKLVNSSPITKNERLQYEQNDSGDHAFFQRVFFRHFFSPGP